MMRTVLLAALLLCCVRPASADAGWFESGDVGLRNDLLLLNDAGVIRLPVNQWPMPRAAVRHAIENGKDHVVTNAAVSLALDRVRARLDSHAPARGGDISFDVSLIAGEAGLLRHFDTTGRENGGLRGGAVYSYGERAEVSVKITGAANPDDGYELRADGSHASVQLGNWLLSAHELDRWWGPSHESSLILSNNARPMPTLMIERATALPFENRFLSWLGPWRMSFGVSRMESDRQDIDSPLFLAWRLVIMPFKDIELGFSRTAQFCGEQLECTWSTFWNMIAGNDNVGIDARPESEPGNQMAGFDIRWNSPIGDWPYAIYSQMIGEDESSYVPAKYLSQYGVEAWKPLVDGGLVQLFLEYTTTTCSAHTGRGPYYNCAYNQGLFNIEGYRYLGRSLGYTADRDAENYSLGASFTAPNGEVWTATLRTAQLNRDNDFDPVNTVASTRTRYDALELGWRGTWRGNRFSIQAGAESSETATLGRDVGAFGYIEWTRSFE